MATNYVRGPHVEFQQIDEEGVLLDMQLGRYFRLNSSATDIWQQLESPSDIDELTGRIGELYEVDPPEISVDVRQVVNDMMQFGLIVTADQDGTATAGRDRA